MPQLPPRLQSGGRLKYPETIIPAAITSTAGRVGKPVTDRKPGELNTCLKVRTYTRFLPVATSGILSAALNYVNSLRPESL